jgi:hypothetical protein
MRTLITHFFPRYYLQAEFFKLTSDFNRAACERMKWSFVADSQRRVPDKNVWREKAAIIYETVAGLPDGDEVLWVDGDCLLIGANLPEIFRVIEGRDYAMAKRNGRWNSGVVPMVVSTQIRNLWRNVRDHTHGDVARCGIAGDHRSIIQGAAETWNANECATCPWPPERRGPLCGSHDVRLVELPRRWNQDPPDVNADTQIIGFHRDTGWGKLAKIKEAVGRYAHG